MTNKKQNDDNEAKIFMIGFFVGTFFALIVFVGFSVIGQLVVYKGN